MVDAHKQHLQRCYVQPNHDSHHSPFAFNGIRRRSQSPHKRRRFSSSPPRRGDSFRGRSPGGRPPPPRDAMLVILIFFSLFVCWTMRTAFFDVCGVGGVSNCCSASCLGDKHTTCQLPGRQTHNKTTTLTRRVWRHFAAATGV